MKVTRYGPTGLPLPLAGWSSGYVSIGSNSDTNPPLSSLNFVQRITANSSNVMLNPIVNFASGSNIILTLDQGPFPTQAYPSNTIRIHSTGGGGGGTISAGSNSTRVAEDPSAGASTTLWSPFDHRHDGIGTITASSSNTMQRGTWNLRAGAGIALGLTDTDGDGEFDTTTISTTAGGGGGSGGGVDNWLIEATLFVGAHGNTNWTTQNVDGNELYHGDLESSGAQNDEIYWDIGISGGTWDFTLMHFKGSNRGIYTVSIDGVSIGTIDGYNATPQYNQLAVITGISITAGKRRLKLKMATKNGSSSNYFGTAQAWQLRRTA